MVRLRAGNRAADGLHEAAEAAQPVRAGVDANPDRRPFAAERAAGVVGDGAQHPFDEQVVDIDADVVVVEGQVRRSVDLETGPPFHVLQIDGRRNAGEAVEKQGPAFLKEGEEGVPVREDGLQRPRSEGAALPQQPRQVLVEKARYPLPPIVPPQQRAQQVGRVLDEFRREIEDVPQREVLGRVVAEPARLVPCPRAVERVEVASVERGDNRMAEGGEQFAQTEGKSPAGLQQVVGKRRQVLAFGPHDSFGAGAVVPVSPGAKPTIRR